MSDDLHGKAEALLEAISRLDSLEGRVREVERATDGEWCVYEIHEIGRDDWPFYIGISTNVARRVSEHWTNRASSAHPRIRALDQVGTDVEYSIMARFALLKEAELFETVQIALRPDLVNRDIVECRDRMGLPPLFWEYLGYSHKLMLKESHGASLDEPQEPVIAEAMK